MHNVPDSRRALHMHVLERDFGIRAACVQHDCATCASMLRDAVTAAQSRFLATAVKTLLSKTTANGNINTDAFCAGLLEFRNTPRVNDFSPTAVRPAPSVAGAGTSQGTQAGVARPAQHH